METVLAFLLLGGLVGLFFFCGYLVSANKSLRSENEVLRSWRDNISAQDNPHPSPHPLDDFKVV